MNKKLFETRMNSVKHYQNEIKNLEQAKEVTEKTLKELVCSFLEFNPFKNGDVILIGDRVMKISSVSHACSGNLGIELCLLVRFPDSYGGYQKGTERRYINFSDLENVKILFSEPEQQ